MSYEVWGEPEDPPELPEGCWDEDQVHRVLEAVKELREETLYQNGRMAEGVSVRFLSRITMLLDACGLMSDPLQRAIVDDAERVLDSATVTVAVSQEPK